jgi:hypothetical protein
MNIDAAANKITAHNAGWPSQFRFAVGVFWCGASEFRRSAHGAETTS